MPARSSAKPPAPTFTKGVGAWAGATGLKTISHCWSSRGASTCARLRLDLLMLAPARIPRRHVETPRGEGVENSPHLIKRPEQALQIATAEFLDWALMPPYRWLHIPNGERRDAVIGKILKAMGVKPGAADALILGPSFPFCWLEQIPHRRSQGRAEGLARLVRVDRRTVGAMSLAR